MRAHAEGPLTDAALEGADVLVLAHGSDPRWERVVPGGSPQLTDAELDAVERFVARGGGLLVLGECEQEKYGTRLNDLLGRFGFRLGNDTVSDYVAHHQAPHWVLADLEPLPRVQAACFYRAGVVDAQPEGARVLARAAATASAPGAALLAVAEHGEGRIVVLADSDLFGDDCLGEFDHEALLDELVHWAARHAFAHEPAAVRSDAAADPAWARLRDAADALRLLQQADGALAPDADRDRAGALVEDVATAIEALAGRFAHQADYLEATVGDLRAWAAGGFGVPDFTASLERFRPDLHRVDGIEHLVVFPMYKQNGSRDKVFEALIVRVPWPAWLAELERDRYDNAKFVPVTLVDCTAGYDSECAVLFPETVSVAGKPANHFGAIFCDREAERFRRVGGAAADLLTLDLPADAAALLASPRLSQDAYVLWDLVHDRAHSHGDLPFDPFMIRQRMPYWMYALEELRCDLTAFVEAMALEREGFAFARHVQYAILFDRLFRFPVTGSRVRNYDGLGGQLLFAYLHRHGHVHWTDNRLTHRVGRPSPTASPRCARRCSPSTATASTARSSRSGARRTTSSRATSRRRRARGGRRTRGRTRRSRTRAPTSTTSSPTSSRCRCSTPSSRASSRPRSTAPLAPSSARSWPHERAPGGARHRGRRRRRVAGARRRPRAGRRRGGRRGHGPRRGPARVARRRGRAHRDGRPRDA